MNTLTNNQKLLPAPIPWYKTKTTFVTIIFILIVTSTCMAVSLLGIPLNGEAVGKLLFLSFGGGAISLITWNMLGLKYATGLAVVMILAIMAVTIFQTKKQSFIPVWLSIFMLVYFLLNFLAIYLIRMVGS